VDLARTLVPVGCIPRKPRGPGILERPDVVVIALDGAPGSDLSGLASELATLLPGGATLVNVATFRCGVGSRPGAPVGRTWLPSGIDGARLQARLENLRARRERTGSATSLRPGRRPSGADHRPFVILHGAFALADPGARQLVDLAVYVDLDRRESVRRLSHELYQGRAGLRERLDVSRVVVPKLLEEGEQGRRSAALHLPGTRPNDDLAQEVRGNLAGLVAA
jgi:uridine kinase